MPRRVDWDLAAFFGALEREHSGALAVQAGSIADRELGGRRLEFRVAGAALAKNLLAPLGRWGSPAATSAEIVVSVWDQRSVPTPAAVPWRDHHLGPGGLLPGDRDDPVRAIKDRGGASLTLFDRTRGLVLHRVTDGRELPWWERAAPLRTTLFWALNGPSRHLIHAGAVGDRARGGALLVGAGGSGKTTVALAGLQSGLRYVADDYLLLDCGGEPAARNLYRTAKLDSGQEHRFPALAAAAHRSSAAEPNEKAVLDVGRSCPGALIESLPVRAVLVPRIRGGHTALRPLTPGEALLALAPSTAFQLPYDGGAVVATLAALVRSVPCFGLDVGDCPSELADGVSDALDAAATGARAA